MARKPRLEVPGGFHHVTVRGVNGVAIVMDDDDPPVFETVLHRAIRRAKWLCHAYCLLTNHFHLLLYTPKPTLGYAMQLLNGGYAGYFDERQGRRGHLFGERFRSRLITSDAQLLATCRYIDLNPVRAGACERPEDWRCSSFRALAGIAMSPVYRGFVESARQWPSFQATSGV